MKTSILLTSSLLLVTSASAAVLDDASFDIIEGWNAVYLPVTPEASADEVFANWPTDKVGMYDQAAFLRTKQFDAEDSTLGAVENGMKIWFRNEPDKSTLRRLVANGIYVFQSTNEADVAVTVRGVPAALRTSWHVSVSTNQPLNFIGISTDGSVAELTEEGYFRGLDTGWTYSEGVIRDINGFDEMPSLDFFHGMPQKGNLGVVAMDAAKVSDWSGALNVSPMGGARFGTNLCQTALAIRNEGGTNRQVRVSLRMSANGLPIPSILCRDARTGGEWTAFSTAEPFECSLLRGATLPLQLAVDRTQFKGVTAGTEYGAIVDVTDVSTENPTHFHTAVPLSVKSDGGSFAETEWPAGLWTVNLSLDKVGDRKAGATMAMRVLVHVATNGVMNLMQRARVGSRRVSSVVLPSDMSASRGTVTTNNWCAAGDGTVALGSGTFGESASFGWTVSDRSRVNPYRHARHPDHDGLDWDFKDTLPSGDNFTNYVASVKPELFSISNQLEMAWNAHTGTAWNPEETLTGVCTWWLYGLRHEGGIKTSGTFTMKRVSKSDLEAIKEEL